MDIKRFKLPLETIFKKYKYAVFILLIGVGLMLLPSMQTVSTKPKNLPSENVCANSVQEQLEAILSYIKGVGKVKVMLKESAGTETIYQTNQDITVSENNSDTRIEVITITDAQRNEQGLVKQVNPPRYAGAIILCEGAENPEIKLAVTEAVSKITGLGTDKIAVLTMK